MINLEEEYLTAERKALQLINVLKRKTTLIRRESASVMTVNVDEVNAKEALRKLEKMNFLQETKGIMSMGDEVKLKLVREGNLKAQLERCKTAQAELVSKLPFDQIEEEMKWIQSLYERQLEISKLIEMLSQKQYKDKEKQRQATSLKLERMTLPIISGKIRDYPMFKADFSRHVMSEITCSQSQAYVLKSCLKGEQLSIIDNVDDDIEEMWKQLDNRYGRPSLLTDVVVNDIKCLKPIKERTLNVSYYLLKLLKR